jgi:hypothetical protein
LLGNRYGNSEAFCGPHQIQNAGKQFVSVEDGRKQTLLHVDDDKMGARGIEQHRLSKFR